MTSLDDLGCKNLEIVHLKGLFRIKSKSLVTFVSSHPKLQALYLESLKDVDDKLLLSISKSPGLHTLNVRDCPKITSQGLIQFATNISTRLKAIVLKFLPLVDSKAIESLAQNCPNLEYLDVQGLNITDETL
jgi:F-box/leucine-rich repeat protein 2/20